MNKQEHLNNILKEVQLHIPTAYMSPEGHIFAHQKLTETYIGMYDDRVSFIAEREEDKRHYGYHYTNNKVTDDGYKYTVNGFVTTVKPQLLKHYREMDPSVKTIKNFTRTVLTDNNSKLSDYNEFKFLENMTNSELSDVWFQCGPDLVKLLVRDIRKLKEGN